MDPKECLRLLNQAIENGNILESQIKLGEYWAWRAKNGFEPIAVLDTAKSGDQFATEARIRIANLLSQMRIAYSVNIDEPPMPWGKTGFASLTEALEWAKQEAQRIERDYDPNHDPDVGQIYCEDTLGNTWSLREENGLYSWEADAVSATA